MTIHLVNLVKNVDSHVLLPSHSPMEYFLHRDGQQWGPYDEATLRSMLAAQQVLPTDLIWNEQMPDWATVGSVFPTSTPVPAPIPALTPVVTPVTATTPVVAAGKSTATPTEKPAVEAKLDKTETGKKSSLQKISAITVAGLVVIGVAVWFFILRGEPETEDSKIIKTVIRKSINKPSGDLSQSDYDQVKSLDLSAKGLSDIFLLKKLKNLEDLNLGGNKIQILEPLSSLSPLKKLDLSGNGITALAAINSLTSLQELSLGGNTIRDITPISNFKALTALDVGNNKIEDLEPLAGLLRLEVINLAQNNVTSLAPLKELKNLKMLIVSGNADIKDAEVAGMKVSLPNCSIQN